LKKPVIALVIIALSYLITDVFTDVGVLFELIEFIIRLVASIVMWLIQLLDFLINALL